ncbi:methylmalonyl-CoA mutase family protein [Lutibacter flavus]|uniref:Heterodimeric methylmalonyl-CoA mutase small subunit n=1 Tax=Lutibacter flavus TaxID=691689 RepID=A0A238Z2T3_9FLAO|nr:methylmalonyl-CoA mutase family protein [Lutibacter flavus]SNR77258.1 heterodimeric methylmalonyl-CoA mutase small subunit [Lutibacter flavus]
MSNLLTEDFEPSSAAAWKQKIQFELNGEDYKTLLTSTNEGITIKPFYHSDNFEKLEIPVPIEDFKICQYIIITAEEEANKIVIESIKQGAKSLKFIVKKSFNIDVVFANILDKKIDFQFEFSFFSPVFIAELAEKLKNETVYFNIDIIGNLAKSGNWFKSLNEDFKNLETIFKPNTSTCYLSVRADIYQNSGANVVQQVAYAIAHANEYLTKFGGNVADKIQFNFAIGSNYFFEIAKIRAFRYLFNLILQEYNTNVQPKVFAQPSLRNKTILGAHINKLRATTECMSAILGGVNTVSSHPFKLKENNLNPLILLKESGAQNIATDSYYIETITKQIAEKALEIFKDIEKSGGLLNQLKEGTIQRKIKENAQKEQHQFNTGNLVLLGANKHPNEYGTLKDLHINPFLKGKSYKTLIVPISPKRLAEKLEQKRLENEA